MISVFSIEATRALNKIRRQNTLYAFDFDGTLSAITPQSNAAFMRRSTLKLMKKLASGAPVAVISGRAAAELRERLEFKPKFVIGSHGLDGILREAELKKNAKITDSWKRSLEALGMAGATLTGAELEDKRYSLSIHYRRCKNRKHARELILRDTAGLKPKPDIVLGKFVINLIPRGAPDKGRALQVLMRKMRAQSAFYVGDDVTDESVFSLRDPRIVTVRVGEKKNSCARYFIRGQSSIDRLLERLLGR